MSEHETSPAPTDSTLRDVADRLYHWHSDPSPITIIDCEIMGHLAAIVDAHLARHAAMVASFQKLYARIPVGPCSQVALDVKTILDADPAEPVKENPKCNS